LLQASQYLLCRAVLEDWQSAGCCGELSKSSTAGIQSLLLPHHHKNASLRPFHTCVLVMQQAPHPHAAAL
jgi:hypothetical protein